MHMLQSVLSIPCWMDAQSKREAGFWRMRIVWATIGQISTVFLLIEEGTSIAKMWRTCIITIGKQTYESRNYGVSGVHGIGIHFLPSSFSAVRISSCHYTALIPAVTSINTLVHCDRDQTFLPPIFLPPTAFTRFCFLAAGSGSSPSPTPPGPATSSTPPGSTASSS